MTNRSPFLPEFTRKVREFHDCLQNYFNISDDKKLEKDLARSDLDLVCNYELHQMRKHVRANPWGLNYHDFFKLSPPEEAAFEDKLRSAYKV
jgi:hypothetical protein